MLSNTGYRYKNIIIPQTWTQAYDNWFATREEKKAFREQFFYFQNPNITFKTDDSCRSYFCQLKAGKLPTHPDAEQFANEFFGINRKFK